MTKMKVTDVNDALNQDDLDEQDIFESSLIHHEDELNEKSVEITSRNREEEAFAQADINPDDYMWSEMEGITSVHYRLISNIDLLVYK